ncbi:tryptamine hydroxycinnamoyltransferase 1-like [Phalaenopsis equestris]|uniref:tryptamine hydroxycinnamoyltransferase 1-like n=1 Tax=Phalaenopsis equestris TaxID=78828 RepID=UPI0009E49BE4|nr:tryptamine hydroxycinnamoyltransferase 1-like [Phalaenopsis equestris]
MATEIISTTTLKATSSPPNHPNIIPLTIFDFAAPNFHVPILYAFLPPTPSNESLKSGLSRVLSHFPHLAGRISSDHNRRPFIILNNYGVRVVETEISATLSETLPLDSNSNLSALHPHIGEGVEELLQIQLNRYACGGLVIGTTSHHRVADGQSMSVFFAAWAKMVRVGEAPNPPPFLDRNAVVEPRNPPRCEFDHRSIEFKSSGTGSSIEATCTIKNLKVRFSSDFITKVKSGVRCSTFEALLAHLWRKISAARGLKSNEATKVRVAVNGRARLKSPSIPTEFFGNLVLWAHPKSTVEELTPATNAVSIIHEAVERIDDAYFRSFIDFGDQMNKGEDLAATAPAMGNSLCPNLEVDSWLRFNFHDLDFGTGAPCAFLPPNLPVEGLMVFVPSMKEKGGVEVFMALAAEHVEQFKNICYSLD